MRWDDFRYLLELHRFTAGYDNGFWVTMRVFRVPPNQKRPHGLQYALRLHDRTDARVLGYGNAHVVDEGTGPARRSRSSVTADHIHRPGKKRVPYDFASPTQLLEDF